MFEKGGVGFCRWREGEAGGSSRAMCVPAGPDAVAVTPVSHIGDSL